MNRSVRVFILFAVGIFVLDQITKFVIVQNMALGQSIPLLQNILHLTLVHNFGAGFGILQNQTILLIAISVVVAGVLTYYATKLKKSDTYLATLLGVILGGTLGNVVDRIALGYVVDFVDFRVWPVFNVADSAITIGILLLIVYLWKQDQQSK